MTPWIRLYVYVFGQLNDDKKYVIAYGGKSLSADQRKVAIEKECLAVLTGIEAYKPYLVHGKFTVVTDHKALVWLHTAKHTGRLERWAVHYFFYCKIVSPYFYHYLFRNTFREYG